MLIVYALLSIGFSFLCSIWEAVILSVPASYVEAQYKSGTWVGKKLKDFKQNIDRPLAAILTLNTIAHTVGAMGVGAEAAAMYKDSEPFLNIDAINFHLNTEGLIAVVMTLAILILSEIIPKTLGANFWKPLTRFTVMGVNAIIIALFPLVWVSQWITKLLKADPHKSVLSRQDFSIMAEIGTQEGVFNEGEFRIINNLLKFQNIKAKDIMTPRTVVHAVPETMTLDDYFKKYPKLTFSRIPVHKGSNKDDVIGFFLKDEMLLQLAKDNHGITVGSIARPIKMVKEDTSIPEIFNYLHENREHIVLVIGQYGGMAGVLSMEDVVETLFGLEILDEFDNEEDMQSLARKKWQQRAKELGLLEGDEFIE